MESEFDSYEDLEVNVWKLEHENNKLTAQVAVLREALESWNKRFEYCVKHGDLGDDPRKFQHLNIGYINAKQALSNTNEQAEKMLAEMAAMRKVVEAAKQFVTAQRVTGFSIERGASTSKLIDAVREYLGVK